MLAKFRDFDFYRKIPKDLTETSTHGAILSVCAAIFMLILFVAEFWAFLTVQTSTTIVVDSPRESLLRINFNITVLDMPCQYATIDAVDVLGTRNENVTLTISKWQVDENGIRKMFEGKNSVQRDIEHETHHDLKALESNGIHAVPIDAENFGPWLEHYEYTFVNFYAPWCVWCQRLEPVWEAFAEKVEQEQLPVSIVKVDCMASSDLCTTEQKIQAFPTLRLFKRGQAQPPDYRNDRTVDALSEFVKSRLALDEQLKLMQPEEREAHEENTLAKRDDHPGCMMVGYLLVNRFVDFFVILLVVLLSPRIISDLH
jgi:protein disulfide-isomerase-like protein